MKFANMKLPAVRSTALKPVADAPDASAGRPAAPAPAPTLVDLAAVGLSYGTRSVLEGITLSLAPGEMLVLLGPNGAGKSSLMRLIAGRLAPSRGRVRVEGADPHRHAAARRAIGWVTQDIALYPRLTVRENLDVFARFAGLRGAERRDGVATALRLGQVAHVASQVVGTLSGGYQRRVDIAAALFGPPRLALLDEPTQGLDRDARAAVHAVLAGLRAAGAGVVVATHDFAEAERLADRVAILRDGRLVLLDSLPVLLARARAAGPEHDVLLAEPAGEETQGLLVGAGFARDADGLSWSSARHHASSLDALLATLRGKGAQVREVRAREPGLDSVYRYVIGERRPMRAREAAE